MKDVKHTHRSSQGTLNLLWVFLALVFFAVLVSLGYRVFTIMQESRFDGKHLFIASFIYKNDLDIIALDPGEKSFRHLTVRGGTSSEQAQRYTNIVSDITLQLSEPFSITKLSDYFSNAPHRQKETKRNLTIYDRYRLSEVAKHVNEASIVSEKVHIPYDMESSVPLLQRLFQDAAATQENKTIAISNGSGTPGVGTQLEKPLILMGMNVIAVTNPQSLLSRSEIRYAGEVSYTATRLARLLDLPLVQDESLQFSDIVIQLGKDRSRPPQ